jgi:hypothetical protein
MILNSMYSQFQRDKEAALKKTKSQTKTRALSI